MMMTDSNKPPHIQTVSELRKAEQRLLDAIDAAAPERARLMAKLKAAQRAVSEVLERETEQGIKLDSELRAAQANETAAAAELRRLPEQSGLETRLASVQQAIRLTEQREASALRARLLPLINAEVPKVREAMVQAVARYCALLAIRDDRPATMFDAGVVVRNAAGELGGALAARIAPEIEKLKRG